MSARRSAMAEAKTAIKRGGIKPGNDVLPRYLQGSQYTTRAMRYSRGGSGGAKKMGKKKVTQLKSSVAIDKEGYTIGGWSNEQRDV